MDEGWTAEIALPWEGLAPLFETSRPPEVLRAGFHRFRPSGPGEPSDVGSLNAHGLRDCHLPERFSFVHLEA
jgi:hypothetical protein